MIHRFKDFRGVIKAIYGRGRKAPLPEYQGAVLVKVPTYVVLDQGNPRAAPEVLDAIARGQAVLLNGPKSGCSRLDVVQDEGDPARLEELGWCGD